MADIPRLKTAMLATRLVAPATLAKGGKRLCEAEPALHDPVSAGRNKFATSKDHAHLSHQHHTLE